MQLTNEDNMELMARYPDGYFDLAIVDPPYEITSSPLRHGGTGAKKFKEWDIAPKPEYFTELFRVSKNQIIWGGNYFDLPPTRGIICWDKVQPWEIFSQWEMAWTYFNVPASMFKFNNRTGDKIHMNQLKLFTP